jgi:hypothetical protein
VQLFVLGIHLWFDWQSLLNDTGILKFNLKILTLKSCQLISICDVFGFQFFFSSKQIKLIDQATDVNTLTNGKAQPVHRALTTLIKNKTKVAELFCGSHVANISSVILHKIKNVLNEKYLFEMSGRGFRGNGRGRGQRGHNHHSGDRQNFRHNQPGKVKLVVFGKIKSE